MVAPAGRIPPAAQMTPATPGRARHSAGLDRMSGADSAKSRPWLRLPPTLDFVSAPNERQVAVELRDVTRTYRMGDETIAALSDVSLRIAQGTFAAITGPSGSGKSTLANIIGGIDTADHGSVIVDGIDLARARDGELSAYRNRTVGFVFQSFNLQGSASALDNVMLPLTLGRMPSKQRRARARECLEAVGLGDRVRHRPTELSGGQRQRVAIARALANRPSILIADEPTGNLDSERGQEIMELLGKLHAEGLTLIVITHDDSIAGVADRILHIKDGALTESTA